ncbi:hypothetical protein [Acidipropionibacterium jensenii]|nr:hypothetical protein [Acidipropionibacterium jensenii]
MTQHPFAPDAPGQPGPGTSPWQQPYPGMAPQQPALPYLAAQPAQPYPAQQYSGRQPALPPMGAVDLTIQGSVMTSNMITPTVVINGHHIGAHYGWQRITVPVGPVHVDAFAQWTRTYGQASLDFQLAAGQCVPVFYAAPMHQFSTGSIGHVRQQRKGMGPFLIIMAVLAVVLALVVTLNLRALG